MADIDKKLLAIQTTLVARKDLRNDFAKFNYRSLEGITKAVKPLLHEHGCNLVISDAMVEMGGRFYIKATAKITDIESGGFIAATGWAREQETKKGMDEAQITGSVSSYARKYACNGLFAIDDTKDPDFGKQVDDKKEAAATAKYEKKAAAGAASLNQGNIDGWIAVGVGAIMKDHTPAEWWAEFKERVIADCGVEGARQVHKKVVK